MKSKSHALTGLPLLAAIVAAVSGCVSMAERVGGDLVERDLRTLEQEFKVFGNDLGQFRGCLTERGGSCQADPAAALPHSSQHVAAKSVDAIPHGASQTLTDSVSKLPDGHAAKDAISLVNHPVVGQAAALHNHLRGHDTGSVPGISVERGTGAHGGPESTVTMGIKANHVHHLHRTLLASLGTTAWESLHGHCADLLTAHGNAPGRDRLEADCRRVAFIRGYLEAYTRTGEFLEVDVELTGAIAAVQKEGKRIDDDIGRLVQKIDDFKTGVSGRDSEIVKGLGSDAAKVGDQAAKLVEKAGTKFAQRFGSATISDAISDLAGSIGRQAEALVQAADRGLSRDVNRLATDLKNDLDKLKKALNGLQEKVDAADSRLVARINDEVDKENARLSNVFKVSAAGFVSRDSTFRARLPTLELTFDPTISHLLTVTDEDTKQVLSRSSDFANLGVATDNSGVGTGNRIGAELVRVFLEAIFDAHEGLPAVAPANSSGAAGNSQGLQPTGLTLGEYSLPLFNSPMGNVDAADLSEMTHTNTRVAAMTRSIMSRFVGGLGPLSLNNPALETFIVEIVTTSVREATAKATWCWYACNLDVELKKLETEARTTVDDEVSQVEDRVKSDAKKAAEHVKMRFRLDRS